MRELSFKKNRDEKYAIVKMDIDNFKVVNDIFGYAVGDEIIKLIHFEMLLLLQTGELFARINGDHFIMLLSFKNNKDLTKRISRHWEDFLGKCKALSEATC